MVMLKAVALLALAVVANGDCGCTSDETCCKDPEGAVCCINVATFCAPKADSYPARCCPNWTVPCKIGKYGCCDPARPWGQYEALPLAMKRGFSKAPVTASFTGSMYALFASGLSVHLHATTIQANGSTTKVLVTGPASVWYEELYGGSTRLFSFDQKRKQFYFVDPVGPLGQLGKMQFYSIDAKTGVSALTTLDLVTTKTSYPIGMYFHQEQDVLVFAIKDGQTYVFYKVDPTSKTVTKSSEIPAGADETSPSFYAGYISEMDLSGSVAYRVGYEQVSTGSTTGFMQANLTTRNATWDATPAAPGCHFYHTVTRMADSDLFISLAATTKVSGSFNIVRWGPKTRPTVLKELEDAHPPSARITGILGYVGTSQIGSTFAALVVHNSESPSPVPTKNKWAIMTYDLTTGATTEQLLTPGFSDAEGATLSGFGITQE